MKSILAILLFISVPFFAEAQFGKILDKAKEQVGIGEDDISGGLKEALEKGAGRASETLSIEDGFYKSVYKITLPEEAQRVVKQLSGMPGFRNLEEDLVERINRAAELAANKAKPIFVDAIKAMSIRDATHILMGEDDAATQYLHRNTHDRLFAEFLPVIQSALDEVNAIELWESATTAYNRIPMVRKVETRLDDHVTRKALEGLFDLVAVEELKIRTDVSARTSSRLREVFAKQDKK
nr:DUF4197 domain-containing protein [Saprospiraceae bacterium]